MSSEPLHLAMLVGSTRPGRFAPVIRDWMLHQVEHREDMKADIIDLAETAPTSEDFATRIDTADAFVVVTPEYNHSYPGALKTAIDTLHAPWQAKPVGFVSYGGLSGGLRAVEALRTVFAELHTVTIRETVSFHQAPQRFDEHGKPHEAEAVNTAATTLLDQLAWWGRALRRARIAQPYGT
ncbi:NAD(P)H-dependent FMN reductase [Saccharopolyspora lacisalsi]|uniref:NAD(P)H-dependent FMN reductase n=1 Tax=Halosaccharopolyspora lacisalsi TaxID=1000566 RepID=A0A839DZR4_9PSEU|nr:NAD(P)H-dependent oxidoreductase [Halosaccharopolyspora lacisalsi]MBA8824711.1 NAD(P)H-dependent FMN reductase [Halosaccharopolyspora lacisalsi]